MLRARAALAAALVVGGFIAAGVLQAADAPTGKALGHVTVATNFRASKLMGMAVKNPQGESLGKIEDFMINLENGKIQYVAVSYGGVLGIGDKLFAVPFSELAFNHGKEEMCFVTNIPKDRLANAPGFDKDKWPDFADQQTRDQVDQYYRTK